MAHRESDANQPVSPTKENLSRRRLLQGAAVTAAAAAAGSAVVLTNSSAHAGAKQLIQSFGLSHASVSGQDPSNMCFEDTNFLSTPSFVVHSNGESSPGSFFIWFTAQNVSAGKYTISITPDPGDSTTPFRLQANGNNAFLYKLTAGTATSCPPSTPTGQVGSSHSADGLFPYSFTGATSDLQLQIHLKYDGGAITAKHTYTFTGTITNNTTNTIVGTATVSVIASPA